MSLALKNALVKDHGLKPDATFEEAKVLAMSLVTSGALSMEKMVDLLAQPAPAAEASSVLDKLTASIVKAQEPLLKQLGDLTARVDAAEKKASERAEQRLIDEAAEKLAEVAEKAAEQQMRLSRLTDTVEEDPGVILASGSKGVNIRVKDASERYSTAKSNASYPTKTINGSAHPLGGQPVRYDERALEYRSQAELAMAGAFMMVNLASQKGMGRYINQHTLDLANEACHKLAFVGDLRLPDGWAFYRGEKLREPHRTKTIFADSTSGGSNLIPQVLDDEIIRNMLLFDELFPYVTSRTQPIGTSVDFPTMVNLTLTSTTNEETAISPQSTASLFSKLNTPFFSCTGMVKLGRDFLADSPLDVMGSIRESYTEVAAKWIDEQIATGDGTTEPLGIFNTSGTTVVGQSSPSPTGWDVNDIENMMRSLPKQYRNRNPNVRWVGTDTTYFRIRGISVSTSDQRRVFGMDHETYKLFDRDFSVQNSVGNANLALCDLKRYMLLRKAGMEIRMSEEGETLMKENAVAIVVRSRWAGRLVLPEAMSEFNSGPA